MRTIDSSSKKDGFRMPGEFEKHAGCYIIWPERPDNWRLGAKPAQKAFVDVATAISRFEPVTVVASSSQYVNARYMLPDEIRVVEMDNDDAWVRDSGPTFVVNDSGDVRGVDWSFNSWGGLVDGLYFPWDKDDQVAQKICELERKDRYHLADFVLEGGSIHVDGEGTLVTTEECLLSEGRNPQLSKQQIEMVLKEYLNLEKIIWLKRGIYLDETNGHVDNIFNYVRPGVVALAWTDDETDPQYEISKECFDILSNETDAKGRKLEVHKINVPKPILITDEESKGVDAVEGTLPREEGDRLAASYINYYTANGGVVFPLFGDPNDELAREKLRQLYPNCEVVGVKAREILLGGGNIHCITQQVPRG
ncbi:TPA: agmatine deiminase [Listeria monocytogenes]|uniref:agmatine deiminase n=1 Tax=Listeria monocytogenes TaxID=1639 RepID=UPI000D37EA0A|nr:agmatine deiminase [Listeria monocytogenes]EAC3736560.1 agmatine deiminase [Listeria monocytogenes]EAC8137263.1 agmatine deiminase [Listeria monocytogenes]EAC8143845.1 agmatine deiminase [Listeria monocytogenes]EAC8146941.1 agmatine deiminase [Listeria monocytogenes]EAC8152568.1 agmatine deiminase [Listeria monocytogenes]